MNKKLLVLTLCTGTFLSNISYAIDGTVNFTGNIIATTCSVDPAEQNQTKLLGNYDASSFKNTGDVAGSVAFSIHLMDCDTSITQAGVRFDGARANGNNDILAVTGGAAGIGVALYEKDSSTFLPLSKTSTPITISNSVGELSFVAKYMATNTTVTPGQANAVTQFSIDYN
ncbi:fimbrial protein [Serratia sp. L9]|uniref:fimbrial protein n=1 Tax=Serratia sp. L9 TaxID=3423946 RepID=UPI003D67A02A